MYGNRGRLVFLRRSMGEGDQWVMHRYGSGYENMEKVIWYGVCSC